MQFAMLTKVALQEATRLVTQRRTGSVGMFIKVRQLVSVLLMKLICDHTMVQFLIFTILEYRWAGDFVKERGRGPTLMAWLEPCCRLAFQLRNASSELGNLT